MKRNKTNYKLCIVAIMTLILIAAPVLLNIIPSASALTVTVDLEDISYTRYDMYGGTLYTVSVTDLTATFESTVPYKIRIQGQIVFQPINWGAEAYRVKVRVPLVASTKYQTTNPQYGFYKSGGDQPVSATLLGNRLFGELWYHYTGWSVEAGLLYTEIMHDAVGCELVTQWDFPYSGSDPQYKTLDYTITLNGVVMSRMFWGITVIDTSVEFAQIFVQIYSRLGIAPIFSMYLQEMPQWMSLGDRLIKMLKAIGTIVESSQPRGDTDVFWVVPVGDAVDNENLDWYGGGDNYPQLSVDSVYYDDDAIKIGSNDLSSIGNNQQCYIQTTVTGPGTVSFYWKVSSEEYCDYLKFYIDGSSGTNDKISGSTGWTQKSYSIASGSHTLKWEYSKDGSVTQGSDCGWVDYVQWNPEPAPYTPGVYGPYIQVSGGYELVSTTYLNTPYLFASYTSDPEGENIQYVFDWGDGTTTTTGWYPGGDTAAAWHTWSTPGQKTIKVKAFDPYGAWSESGPFTVNIINRSPNTPSTPSGPTSGYWGTSYTYSTSTTDPDGDTVQYVFDWGDGSTTYSSYYTSGSQVSRSHTWSSPGTYHIKVRAIDHWGVSSGWSSYLTVTVTNPPNTVSLTVLAYNQYGQQGYVPLYIDGEYVGTTGYAYPVTIGDHSIQVESPYWGDYPYYGHVFDHYEYDSTTNYNNPITVPMCSAKTVTAYYMTYPLY